MKQLFLFFTFIICLGFVGCDKAYIPRPYGYFRVDLPEHAYRPLGDTLNLPYTFNLSKYASITESTDRDNEKDSKYWIDINYPGLNAYIYCSYKPLKGNLYEVSEESRKIVYKHDVRADGIGERFYEDPDNKIYGILYDLDGNTASVLQFVLTDSVRHFFRGAVYFNNVPNQDSIAPMADFVRQDVLQIMESFRWTR